MLYKKRENQRGMKQGCKRCIAPWQSPLQFLKRNVLRTVPNGNCFVAFYHIECVRFAFKVRKKQASAVFDSVAFATGDAVLHRNTLCGFIFREFQNKE
jgi:hypothetical protein